MPCRTIKHAVSVAASGDTIQLGSGAFSEDYGVTIDKDLTIIGSLWLFTHVKLGWYISDEGECCPVFTVEADANVILRGMTISGGNGRWAGGIFIREGGDLTLQNVVISGNRATLGAGGIFNAGSLVMTNVQVDHNHGNYGLLNSGFGVASVSDSRITGTYGGNGHGVGVDNGTLTIDRGLIAGNQGTGLSVWPHAAGPCPDVVLTNVTISGNSAGGVVAGNEQIDCTSHAVRLKHVTIAANTGKAGPGGLLVHLLTPVLENSIVATNTGAQCEFRGYIASISVSSSLIGDNSCLAFPTPDNLIGVDPKLGPLAYHGANDPVAQVLHLGATKAHALKLGSPAIDSGADAFCAATDQLGVLRPIDGNRDGVARCDMGAFEYKPPQRLERLP